MRGSRCIGKCIFRSARAYSLGMGEDGALDGIYLGHIALPMGWVVTIFLIRLVLAGADSMVERQVFFFFWLSRLDHQRLYSAKATQIV